MAFQQRVVLFENLQYVFVGHNLGIGGGTVPGAVATGVMAPGRYGFGYCTGARLAFRIDRYGLSRKPCSAIRAAAPICSMSRAGKPRRREMAESCRIRRLRVKICVSNLIE